MASDRTNLCSNGCGFFGSPATLNLCSKCYRVQALSAFSTVEKSINLLATPAKVAEEATPATNSVPPPAAETEKKKKKRCGWCKKKVGLVGFECKCGTTFCGSHRYPEAHDCSVDFKLAGKQAIANANPVVKSDKLHRC